MRAAYYCRIVIRLLFWCFWEQSFMASCFWLNIWILVYVMTDHKFFFWRFFYFGRERESLSLSRGRSRGRKTISSNSMLRAEPDLGGQGGGGAWSHDSEILTRAETKNRTEPPRHPWPQIFNIDIWF